MAVQKPWWYPRAMPSGDKIEQSLYWSTRDMEYLKSEAFRLDRSLSWVVQRSWTLARDQIQSLKSRDDASDTGLQSEQSKVKQTLYFPDAMLVQMRSEATRLDCSMSWLVHVAVGLARSELAKLPTVEAG
jgi:uncharacterized small protein (TIGR04563 family)